MACRDRTATNNNIYRVDIHIGSIIQPLTYFGDTMVITSLLVHAVMFLVDDRWPWEDKY